jgi:hypothetical protein
MKKPFQQRSYLHDGLIIKVYTLTGKADRSNKILACGNINHDYSPETGSESNSILLNQIDQMNFPESPNFQAG